MKNILLLGLIVLLMGCEAPVRYDITGLNNLHTDLLNEFENATVKDKTWDNLTMKYRNRLQTFNDSIFAGFMQGKTIGRKYFCNDICVQDTVEDEYKLRRQPYYKDRLFYYYCYMKKRSMRIDKIEDFICEQVDSNFRRTIKVKVGKLRKPYRDYDRMWVVDITTHFDNNDYLQTEFILFKRANDVLEKRCVKVEK